MDKRTLLIIVLLILPLVAVVFLAQGGDGQKNNEVKMGSPPALDAGAALNRRPPSNLEEARARAKQRLAELDKMTEADFQAEQKARREAMERQNPRRSLPPLEPRLPDTPGQPASLPQN